ncbi:hypothetical protein CEXT_486571 [Caerostris extrusa]|uniref:RNase H type-1 domain-containing protein n=1 Tax=Caerostris extrusa TaxID=172846 RepID=A0AAV4SSQ1_CAEEX|nr:hypothetical protein CEXT_486571 [Caerostris extrusa]
MFQLKHDNKELCTQGTVIQPHSLSFLKPILPPWNCSSIPWTLYSNDLQGVLIFTDGSKINNRVAGAFVVRSLGRGFVSPCPASQAAWRPSRVLRYVEGLLSRHRSSDLEAFRHVILILSNFQVTPPA